MSWRFRETETLGNQIGRPHRVDHYLYVGLQAA